MIYYPQKGRFYSPHQLGTCNTTIGSSGCFVCSLAMLDNRSPDIVNALLRNNGGYSGGCNMISDRAAQILGLEYNGKTTNYQTSVCIAESDNYKAKGYPQHFFIWLGNGFINDPILGENIVNPYHIVSYRLFKPKQEGTQMKINNPEVKVEPNEVHWLRVTDSATYDALKREVFTGNLNEWWCKKSYWKYPKKDTIYDSFGNWQTFAAEGKMDLVHIIDPPPSTPDMTKYVLKSDYDALDIKYKELLAGKDQVVEGFITKVLNKIREWLKGQQ